MTYTTKASIPVMTVLPAGTPPTDVTAYNYHASILNGMAENLTSNGVVVVQPTATVDGHITINVTLTLGTNIIRLYKSSNSDLDQPSALTAKGVIVIIMVEDAIKAVIGDK